MSGWYLDDDLFCVFVEEPLCDAKEDVDDIVAIIIMQRTEDEY